MVKLLFQLLFALHVNLVDELAIRKRERERDREEEGGELDRLVVARTACDAKL